jgi:hypothetical protein
MDALWQAKDGPKYAIRMSGRATTAKHAEKTRFTIRPRSKNSGIMPEMACGRPLNRRIILQ